MPITTLISKLQKPTKPQQANLRALKQKATGWWLFLFVVIRLVGLVFEA